jgi:hypothetical protein
VAEREWRDNLYSGIPTKTINNSAEAKKKKKKKKKKKCLGE